MDAPSHRNPGGWRRRTGGAKVSALARGKSALAGKRVLILEDEPVIGLALEDILEALGCKVTGIAHQVAPAIELINLREFDAAILDVNIHGSPNYEVADLLAARGVPYVFATAYDSTVHPKAHSQAPTVTKPYSTSDLATALLQYFG